MQRVVPCRCSRVSVGLHCTEPNSGFGAYLYRSWSWIWPTQNNPRISCGAADSLSFHQNWVRFSSWSLAAPQWGGTLCHLERQTLPEAILLFLETAKPLFSCSATYTKRGAFTPLKRPLMITAELFRSFRHHNIISLILYLFFNLQVKSLWCWSRPVHTILTSIMTFDQSMRANTNVFIQARINESVLAHFSFFCCTITLKRAFIYVSCWNTRLWKG